MKFSSKIFALILLANIVLACNNSNSSKEKSTEQKETTKSKTTEQVFLSSVEDIHKKEKFFSEDIVSYQITYQFGNLKDELKVRAATDLSLIEITSKNFGKSYYNGKNILIDAMANMGDREAKRNFQLVFFYHAFFHLDENEYVLSPIQETTFFDGNFKQIHTKNEAFHTAFFPNEVSFLVEGRTNMMKGLQMKTSLLGNNRTAQNIHLHYDRFITVNHIPVSLNWKFYPENNFEEKAILGEAQITKIKYYSAEQLQLSIPENTKKIKNSPIL
ncbi:hypothetical protein [Psychroflexus planctonicus]|uniref:Uncharacterized protein n=1 Tax=Psychroflexus planctonicus TaxID=1526575 RepID=A0ABQ1SGW4_9FLAO|nr:hypothetical protein [Psychroflexus planctonicus]GGE31107.1 hypothetical protein GCM10010832_09390 [Psychroflexus planctonicus]